MFLNCVFLIYNTLSIVTNVTIISNKVFNSTNIYCQSKLGLIGKGSQWKEYSGIEGLWLKYNEHMNVYFKNNLNNQPATIHAHGQQPPMYMDGVPDLDTSPITKKNPYQIAFYKPLSGTFFIHSHWGYQHELGVSAPLIIEDNPNHLPIFNTPYEYITSLIKKKKYVEVLMYLEDYGAYTDLVPNLNCTDTYSIYKYLKLKWKKDYPTFNFSNCMLPSTSTDVKYRYHLANNILYQNPKIIHINNSNTYVRLRIINAAGFTNYNIQIPKELQAILIATDSNWIKPYKNNYFWIATAQRLDLILKFNISSIKSFTIYAIAEGLNNSGKSRIILTRNTNKSRIILTRNISTSTIIPKEVGYMGFWETRLKALYPLVTRPIYKNYTLNITGDNGFMSFNKKSWQLRPLVKNFHNNPYPIKILPNKRICLKLVNYNSDNHPIHVHGHFFQLIEYNGKTINGPMRDTILVPRGNCNNITICLDTHKNQNNTKWPIHCHLSWHLVAGMLTSLEYNV